jgi:hypothetical protein
MLNFLCLGDVPAKNPRLPIDSSKETTGRWKNRNVSSSKKMKRNRSAPYVSDTTGRNISGCEVGPPCKCKRNKCWSLLHGELHTFNIIWNLRDFNIQNAYAFSCIKATRPKWVYSKKISKSESSRRNSTFSYHVKVEGSDIMICKEEFMSFHVTVIKSEDFVTAQFDKYDNKKKQK